MKNIKHQKTTSRVLVLFLILILFQTILIILLGYKVMKIPDQINSTHTFLNEKININNAELQAKINQLTENLISVEGNIMNLEEDFESEISSIKAETSADFSGIIQDSIESVVTIRTDVSQGTGFIITNDGYLVTNAHVLAGARQAVAITSDRQSKTLSFIGYDTNFDIALLKIEGDYPFLELENSNNVRVGEKVIAIGNPLGLSFSVTEGIVSGVDRLGANEIPAYIQTDAALNPGNSGGPLINTDGDVIGINNFKVMGESLGFALESNFIEDVVNDISLQTSNQTIL